jgi:hypothetical protein
LFGGKLWVSSTHVTQVSVSASAGGILLRGAF